MGNTLSTQCVPYISSAIHRFSLAVFLNREQNTTLDTMHTCTVVQHKLILEQSAQATRSLPNPS